MKLDMYETGVCGEWGYQGSDLRASAQQSLRTRAPGARLVEFRRMPLRPEMWSVGSEPHMVNTSATVSVCQLGVVVSQLWSQEAPVYGLLICLFVCLYVKSNREYIS